MGRTDDESEYKRNHLRQHKLRCHPDLIRATAVAVEKDLA